MRLAHHRRNGIGLSAGKRLRPNKGTRRVSKGTRGALFLSAVLSARDWRAAEAPLQVPAFARFRVDDAKGRRRSGDREKNERSSSQGTVTNFAGSSAVPRIPRGG